MSPIWLCVTSLLSITHVICDRSIDPARIRVFPAANQSIAGVFQASYLNEFNVPEYAFNASEARRLCSSLGVNIASKAQVQEALRRGLETCRFGWIDEHFAVVPRNNALSNCGKNQTGLVPWRASVKAKFDVFCFNESDAEMQLKETTTNSPLTSREYWHETQSPSNAMNDTHNVPSASSSSLVPSSSSTLQTLDEEGEPARFVSSAQGSSGATAIIITAISALLLIAIILVVYLKMRRSRILRPDMKQQQEYIQTEEWTCVIKETKPSAQDDKRIEVGDTAS